MPLAEDWRARPSWQTAGNSASRLVHRCFYYRAFIVRRCHRSASILQSISTSSAACRHGVHFRDGLPSPLEIGGNAASECALEQAMESVEPGSYTAYCDYLVSARANLKAGLPIFIREQLGLDELATLPGFLRAALGGGSESERTTPLRDWPLRSHAAQASELFTAEHHRELACFQDLYIGLAPQDAPSVFSLLQAIELAPIGDEESDSGIFYPLGGWGNVREALLEAVESSGVDCRWNTKVEQVLVSEGDEETVGGAFSAWSAHRAVSSSNRGQRR